MNKPSCSLRTLIADRKAAAAIEFALILPFLILLFLGGVETINAVMLRKKVTQAAGTVSDLIAQHQCVDPTVIGRTFSLADTILAPETTLRTVVSSVTVNATGSQVKVAWSQAHRRSPLAQDSDFSLTPSQAEVLRKPNSSFIVAEVTYQYNPIIGFGITGPIAMGETTFALPRTIWHPNGIPFQASCPTTS